MAQVLHLTGPVLVGPDDVRPQAWVVGGRITYAPPTGDHDVTTVPGWVLPGLVDAHSHIGLGAHGAVDDATAEAQALADRDAGALLLRDAGSPGRHPLGRRTATTCRAWSAPAGTSPAPGATSATSPGRSSPSSSSSRCGSRPARGDGWVKLVGDWIDRDTGDLVAVLAAPTCWPRRSRPPTRRAPG